MAEEPIKFIPSDIDASPRNLEIQSRVDDTVSIKLSEYRHIIEKSDNFYALRDENSQLKSKLNTKEQLDDLIKPSAKSSFKFMCAYCLFVGVVLILQGFKICNFNLADSVIQIIVGSTAVTVIGLVGMVLTGIFIGARQH